MFKQRVRNVRRLQLVCLNLFYERIQLDMPHSDSVPTSKPVQPQRVSLVPAEQLQEGAQRINLGMGAPGGGLRGTPQVAVTGGYGPHAGG